MTAITRARHARAHRRAIRSQHHDAAIVNRVWAKVLVEYDMPVRRSASHDLGPIMRKVTA